MSPAQLPVRVAGGGIGLLLPAQVLYQAASRWLIPSVVLVPAHQLLSAPPSEFQPLLASKASMVGVRLGRATAWARACRPFSRPSPAFVLLNALPPVKNRIFA